MNFVDLFLQTSASKKFLSVCCKPLMGWPISLATINGIAQTVIFHMAENSYFHCLYGNNSG